MNEKSSAPRKLLVAIASFGTGGDRYLEKLIAQYQAMPLDVHIVVLSNIDRALPQGVELLVGMPTKDPWSLPFAHKKVFADRANDFDLFIYSENDTPITLRNIEAFLEVSDVLPENEIAGFFRYEESPRGIRNYINLHGHYHWDASSVCRRGPYVFASLSNEHSACYLVTKKQLRKAIDSGGFLAAPHQGKYDLACTAATDPYTVCGFRKVVCISRLEDFLVRHLPDKYTPETFDMKDQEFDRQIQSLLEIADNKRASASLLQAETKLPAAWYSKEYYETLQAEAVELLPVSVHSVLSVGSGLGETERWMLKEGMQVTAIPLDPVIGSALEGSGIELVYGEFGSARRSLDGRKFDCLFLSHILHLTHDPQGILREYAQLLHPGGVTVVVTPNIATLKNQLFGFQGKVGYRDLQSFDKSGVQWSSAGNLKKWFATAGLAVENVIWKASPRFEKFVNAWPKVFGPMFSSEIVVLGKKKG